jgi:hypothetical protein
MAQMKQQCTARVLIRGSERVWLYGFFGSGVSPTLATFLVTVDREVEIEKGGEGELVVRLPVANKDSDKKI